MATETEAAVGTAGVTGPSGPAASAAKTARAKNPNKVRKRAPKACLSCRARKVRCDVSQRGRPCMNCYLDSETCVVTGRASRLRKSQRPPAKTATATGAAPTMSSAPASTDKMAAASSAGVTTSQPAGASQTEGHGTSAPQQTASNGELRSQPQLQVSHHDHDHNNNGPSHNHNDSQAHNHAHQHSSPQSDTASRRRTVSANGSPSAIYKSEPPQQQKVNEAMHSSSPVAGPETDNLPRNHNEHEDSQHQHNERRQHQQSRSHHNHSHQNHKHNHIHSHESHQRRFNNFQDDLRSGPSTDFLGSATGVPGMGVGVGGAAPWAAEQRLNTSADITYSYYPFLAISNISGILPQDVNYLELQGCLRVPTRSILDEFVQQYFLHVHPLLPLFNEGDFWELYCQQGTSSVSSGGRLSLLVFQALLFATCNFVSRTSIRALGFPTIRLARAALYRRSKLLYDFETESSPAAIAQAALLLSFWSPSTNLGTKNPNTAWLCTAIQQAKLAEANHYASLPPDSRRANALKRLWWCCIIRDRVMGLGVRRSIQITRAHFDLEANPPLTRADLADEIERSRVYNPGTKSCLIEILVHMIELCVVLTDILTLVFPQDDTPGWGRQMADSDAGRVRQCKIELRRWYKDVALTFPMFGGSSGNSDGSPGNSSVHASGGGVARLANGGREFYHDSVILYTNLLYMYYHSSRVALCHHEVLHIAVANATPGFANGNKAVPVIYENRYELQDAASGVTECLKELIQLRLARWLPISAVACTALPLFLHILDVKLSTSAANNNGNNNGNPSARTPNEGSGADGNSTSASSALKQHRLNILIEAMKTYQPQYDGVDWVSETIRHIVNLAQLDGPAALGANGNGGNDGSNGGNNNGGISDWTDILASNPSWYLRLALTMDLALSKNRMPEERDFPVGLRGLFTAGFSSIRNLRLGYNKDGSRTNNNNDNNGNGNNESSNSWNGGNSGNMNKDNDSNAKANSNEVRSTPFPPANNSNLGNMTNSQTTNLNGMSIDNFNGMNMHVVDGSQQQRPQPQQPMPTVPTPGIVNMMDDPASMTATMDAMDAMGSIGGTNGLGGFPGGIPGDMGDFPGGDSSAAFMLAPHHLAMSMGMAMGMDIDMDLGDMDMDMSAFPPNALLKPGIVTQLPSSDEEMTPASVSVGTTSSEAANSPQAQQQQQAQHNFGAQNCHPDQNQQKAHLHNDGAMLDAYTFNNGNVGGGSGSPGTTITDIDDHHGPGHYRHPTGSTTKHVSSSKQNKSGHHEAEGDEWIEPSWDDEVPNMRDGDRDTAQALLEAIGENA
ncbi:hypothetical protein HMPREF1624_07063 [Sporothrix schenckii ATCC 58251]|uniref:Zn(2)-C6 fungal-type domain-containing protein n=1 Tax=Sporothrix schenckii (strain ATCC 58251 / de Perez 2211183) TaxID=1391915 RepID=U7PQ34_SPOS1|nr:hypothetical protein HMPREF1624_07063 [Sporothrix schenckii ATCC 58251]